jgi:uncharacterized protein YkwD
MEPFKLDGLIHSVCGLLLAGWCAGCAGTSEDEMDETQLGAPSVPTAEDMVSDGDADESGSAEDEDSQLNEDRNEAQDENGSNVGGQDGQEAQDAFDDADGSNDASNETNEPNEPDESLEDTEADAPEEEETIFEPEVPGNSYCEDVSQWDPQWSAWEDEVVELVNLERGAGATCGLTAYEPTGPVASSPHLRCASGVHSKDMVERGYFSHTNPDDQSPWDRIALAEYPSSPTGENIAAGQASPAAVLSSWMNSPGHCRNIMNPNSNEIGVGYYPGGGYGHYWTQTFGQD